MSNSGGLSEIFIVILGVIIILLIIYMYIKEQEINKTFKVLANRSDTINRQLFTLSKNLQKELENRELEIKKELELLFKANMKIFDWDIPENDDRKSAKLIINVMQEAIDKLKQKIESGEFDNY